MSKENLIKDIYYKLSPFFLNDVVPENNDILERIKDNIKLYGNTPIDEIDQKFSWIKVNIKGVHDSRFINTKKYQEAQAQAQIINKIQNKPQFFPVSDTISWDNRLELSIYRCVLTNSIGFTYYVKNKYMIKPFHVIKHNWKLTEVNLYTTTYVCKSCNSVAHKARGALNVELLPYSDFMLTCEEHIIKKLLG